MGIYVHLYIHNSINESSSQTPALLRQTYKRAVSRTCFTLGTMRFSQHQMCMVFEMNNTMHGGVNSKKIDLGIKVSESENRVSLVSEYRVPSALIFVRIRHGEVLGLAAFFDWAVGEASLLDDTHIHLSSTCAMCCVM